MHKSIFVSSTFQDFQRERDLLQTKVELRTNELLSNLQISFLDLRWGIDTTGETDLEKVVSICIAEVLNSHPFYVIMLGDSYGSCVDSAMVRSLYSLNGLSYDGQQKSVTQIEIEATGLFEGNRKYVLVLDRHTNQTPDPRAAALKQRVLEAADPENIYSYPAEIRDGSVFPKDETALIEFIANRLCSFLKDFPALTESQQTSLAHEHAQKFRGRQEVLRRLHEAVIHHKDSPLFRVYAPRGAGLTALFSKLFAQLQEEGAQAAFLTALSELPYAFAQALNAIASQLEISADSIGSFFAKLDPTKKYFCILDGLDEIESDPVFQNLLRRRQIPDNILFILAVNTPEYAQFTLDYPEKADALEIFDGTFQDYHKELPQNFRQYFHSHIPEEMVRQPAFLMQFISALCYLTEEDYRRLGNSANFMDELTTLFTHKLDHFPENEQAYIHAALLDAPESQLWLLGLLSIASDGLDSRILLGTLRSGGIECDLLQLLTIKERFRDSIRCYNGWMYTITRDSFRNAVRRCFTPEQILYLRYLLVAYIGQNTALLVQPEYFTSIAYQYLMMKDYELLARLLELQKLMPAHSPIKGTRFSLMCGDQGADTPSEHYRALVAQENPHCNCWLVKYAMPYLTDLYRQNGTEMFGLMYKTVQASGIDDAAAADLFSLHTHGLALQLRTQEAHNITVQAVSNKSIKMLTGGSIIQTYLSACLRYDENSAASVIDNMLKNIDISSPGIREILVQLLLITERMEGNALQYLPQLKKLSALCEKYLLSPKCVQPGDIAIPLHYLSMTVGIPIAHEEAILGIVKSATKWDLCLPANLIFLYMKSYFDSKNRALALQELADLICITLESKAALSTLDMFYISAYFRKICYLSPDSIPADTAARFAKDLFRRFWDIRGGIYSAMQMVEMLRLSGMICLYAGTKECLEQMTPLLADSRIQTKELLMELEFFREDAQLLIAVLGEHHAQSLDQLEAIIKQRK